MEYVRAVLRLVALVSVPGLLGGGVEAMDYDPCQISTLNPGGVGSHGNITSTDYPGYAPAKSWSESNCRMLITACPACNIKLYFNEFTAPACHKNHIPLGSCVPGCDHILLFEPDYAESSSQYIFDDSTVETFTTISNRLKIVICHATSPADQMRRFRISFEIQEKSEIIYGEAGGYNESGFFTSPNFPHGYSLKKEVYTYLLQNTDPNGLVRLSFDDWNLSPSSKLTVYFHNDTHPDIYLTRMGSGDRPFVLSSGPSLFIKFETGEDLYSIPYVGFKAKYMFVTDPYWPDKPYTVHDNYFYSRYGGQLSFPTDRCWNGDRVDCIWVITKYKDSNHDQVALNIQSFFVVPNLDTLEIRSGNSSEGGLIGVYDQNNLTGTQFVSKDGFYLRLRATCSKIREFQAVFTSFTNATDDGGCSYYYHFHCGNSRCIAKSLLCDGIDHCGDGTDEQGCTTPRSTTEKVCPLTYICRNRQGLYCLSDRCNGFNDCLDGTDEKNCYISTEAPWTVTPDGMIHYYRLGTYIPIGLGILLMTIVACILISCFARKKRNMSRRRQHTQNSRGFPTISGSLPGGGRRLRSASETHLNINVEIQHYPDSPPSYEEVLSASQSTYTGINNMAFSMSDSSDQLPPPPPYSPRDENPYTGPLPYPSAGLYIPNSHSGGMYIGMPPNGGLAYPATTPQSLANNNDPTNTLTSPNDLHPPPPPPPLPAGPPLTGYGDLGGNADIPEVHSSGHSGSSRRSRDPGRRRSRGEGSSSSRYPNQSQPQQRQRLRSSSNNADSINNNNSEQRRRGANQNSSGTRSNSADNSPSHGGTNSNRRSSSQDDQQQQPPSSSNNNSRNNRRSNSGPSVSPIQNFVQNLISRAARQTSSSNSNSSNSPQPPATLALSTTHRPQQPPPPPSSSQSAPPSRHGSIPEEVEEELGDLTQGEQVARSAGSVQDNSVNASSTTVVPTHQLDSATQEQVEASGNKDSSNTRTSPMKNNNSNSHQLSTLIHSTNNDDTSGGGSKVERQKGGGGGQGGEMVDRQGSGPEGDDLRVVTTSKPSSDSSRNRLSSEARSDASGYQSGEDSGIVVRQFTDNQEMDGKIVTLDGADASMTYV